MRNLDESHNYGHGQNPWSIENCIFNFTYIWLKNGENFWFFLTSVGDERAFGYKFFGDRWNPYSITLREIASFHCPPPSPIPY